MNTNADANNPASDDGRIQLTAFVMEEQTGLTLDDLCRACTVDSVLIGELVEEGILHPAGDIPEQWRFTGLHLHHAKVAVRLQRDLGVNLQGAALVLQLLEELDALKARLRSLAPD